MIKKLSILNANEIQLNKKKRSKFSEKLDLNENVFKRDVQSVLTRMHFLVVRYFNSIGPRSQSCAEIFHPGACLTSLPAVAV